jgi:membrane protein DedA with SNARE-associated domain
MSTAEAVYGELSVQPPIKLSNAAEIGILVAAVVVLVIVVAVVAWWFTKGKKARDLKLQASVPSSST